MLLFYMFIEKNHNIIYNLRKEVGEIMKKLNKNGWGISSEIIMIFFFMGCLLYSIYYINKLGLLQNPDHDVIKEINKEDGINTSDTTYSDLEMDLKSSARLYVNNEYGKVGSDTLIVTSKKLIEEGYLDEMSDPDKKNNSCSGYVEVELVNDKNEYYSYISCSKYYTEGYIKRKDSE